MKVLITGGAGFLGSHLCERLLALNCDVHATSRTKRVHHDSRLHWWQTDLADRAAIETLFDEIEPQVVYHLAGQVSAAPQIELVRPTFRSLLSSSLDVLEVGTERGCQRIVMTGSLTEPAAGMLDPIPSSPYSAAKWAAGGYARMFHKMYKTPVVILRPFMTYGPGQHPTKVVPHIINSMLRGEAPALSSGHWQADWVYVDDVVEALGLAATHPDVVGRTVDLGTGRLTSIRDVAEIISSHFESSSEPQFSARADRPDEEVRVADTNTARAILGWSAGTSLEEGLAKTVRWYRETIDSAAD